MTIEEECRLSFYAEITPLSEEHGVWLVRHKENDMFFVRKELAVYNKDVYMYLMENKSTYFPIVYDIIEDERKLIVIEEFINGKTINQRIIEDGVFPGDKSLLITARLCEALRPLHEHVPPIVNRDIKPSNIMLTDSGDLKIVDFNTAKVVEENKREDTMLIGTREYAAPEQYGFGQSDARTDIYAIGVVLNFMVTGFVPKVKLAESNVGKIVEKCIEIDPNKRFQSINELQRALPGKKCKIDYLPPGFRNRKPLNMIIAVLGYALLFYTAITLNIKNRDGTVILGLQRNFYQSAVIIYGLITIAWITNYCEIHKKFLFMNMKNRWGRLYFGILWWIVGAFAMLMVLALLIGVFG